MATVHLGLSQRARLVGGWGRAILNANPMANWYQGTRPPDRVVAFVKRTDRPFTATELYQRGLGSRTTIHRVLTDLRGRGEVWAQLRSAVPRTAASLRKWQSYC